MYGCSLLLLGRKHPKSINYIKLHFSLNNEPDELD